MADSAHSTTLSKNSNHKMREEFITAISKLDDKTCMALAYMLEKILVTKSISLSH